MPRKDYTFYEIYSQLFQFLCLREQFPESPSSKSSATLVIPEQSKPDSRIKMHLEQTLMQVNPGKILLPEHKHFVLYHRTQTSQIISNK